MDTLMRQTTDNKMKKLWLIILTQHKIQKLLGLKQMIILKRKEKERKTATRLQKFNFKIGIRKFIKIGKRKIWKCSN